MSTTTAEASRHDGWLRRFGFRLGLVYFALYNFSAFLSFDPVLGLAKYCTQLGHAVVPWVGRAVLRLDKPITIFPGGSGDTTYNYVEIWCFLALALIGAAVWSAFDRVRRGDALAHELLRIGLRYVLGVTMISYGLSKVLHLQMSSPSFERLVQPYGESSPMGLLWTFMGQSAAYSFFAGASEVVGGVLLLFRRTTTLGALIVAAVMINVVAMNFCFDVPVKIYSTHLFLMAVFLAAPDLRRLMNVLVLHRPTEPASLAGPWCGRGMRIAALGLKIIVLVWIGYEQTVPRWRLMATRGDNAPKPPLYGLYDVTEFTRNGTTMPPLLTETRRWRRVAFNAYGSLSVMFMDDRRWYFKVKAGSPPGKLTLDGGAGKPPMEFTYTRPAPDEVVIEGVINAMSLTVRLHRIDEQKFLLVNRGFHWINEYPFNR